MAKYDKFSVHTKAGEENWIEMELCVLLEEGDSVGLAIEDAVNILIAKAQEQAEEEVVKSIEQ